MKRIRSSQELYDEIVKSFYFGVYQKDAQYMTQQATKEYYDVARPTAEKVFKMLQQDGLIYSERYHGTIVTFDRNNPVHLAKVPLYHHNPERQEFGTFTLPIILLSNSLYLGLVRASNEQLDVYAEKIKHILVCIEQGDLYNAWVIDLHWMIVSNIENYVLSAIMDHFLSRYFYFNSKCNLSEVANQKRSVYVKWFYEQLLAIIYSGDFVQSIPLMRDYYAKCYQIPDVFVFSIVDDRTVPFQDLAQYKKFFYILLIYIHANGLKKGDALPSVAQMSKKYSISTKTVRKAYDVLAGIGLVDKKQRVGTTLVRDPQDPLLQQWTVKKILEQKHNISQVLEALSWIVSSILQDTVAIITPAVMQQMQQEFREQEALYLKDGLPFFVADVLLTPWVMSMPMGVLQKYYFFLQQSAAEFVSICALEFKLDLTGSEEVYRYLQCALNSLEEGQYDRFVHSTIAANQLNMNLLLHACEQKCMSWMKAGTIVGQTEDII